MRFLERRCPGDSVAGSASEVRLGCSGGGVAGATSDVSTCMTPSISDLDDRWLKGELSKQRVEMRRGLTGERSGECS